jgi:hypothetical protein
MVLAKLGARAESGEEWLSREGVISRLALAAVSSQARL